MGLLDSRATPGPATLAHHDAVLGCLRTDGFSVAEAGHAIAVLDSSTYGFAVQETNLPVGPGEWEGDLAASIVVAMPADRYLHLVELATERVMQPGHDFGDEFAFGLDLVLTGLAALPGPSARSVGGSSSASRAAAATRTRASGREERSMPGRSRSPSA